jgi:ribosomal protein L29
MNIQVIRSKSDTDLAKLLDEQRSLLEDLRFRVRARELKNVHEVRHARKLIARILTVMHQRKKEISPSVA